MGTFEQLWSVADGMRDRFQLTGSNAPPNEMIVRLTGRQLGITFPDEYVELMTKLSAFVVEAKEDVWPAPKALDVGPFWSFCRGIEIFGVGDGPPDFLQLELLAEEFSERTGVGADVGVPFMRIIGSADRFCFRPDGSMFEWLHDYSDEEAIQPVEGDFFDLAVRELTRIGENAERYVQGEHQTE